MDINKIVDEALKTGFTLAAPIDLDTIRLMPEVREMCAVNKCTAYDTNWACPPACGTLEECTAKINEYKSGIIVQTTGVLEDDFDAEGMLEISNKHNKTFRKFLKYLKENYTEDILPLCAGGCTICPDCTYPDEPCRYPDLMVSPMEGYGILISDLCTKNNIKYNHGRGTLTYVSCYLFEK